jgi:hypothetical protein
MLFDHIIPTESWAADHPLDAFRLIDFASLKRRHVHDIVLYLEQMFDVFNGEIAHSSLPPADLFDRLRSSSQATALRTGVDTIIREYWLEQERHWDKQRVRAEMTGTVILKLCRFLAGEIRLLDLNAMSPQQLMERLFRVLGITNLAFAGCDYDENILTKLGAAIQTTELFAHCREIVDLLFPVGGPACPLPRPTWTRRDHLEKLLAAHHEVLVTLAGIELCWEAVVDRDPNDIVRSELIYYASQHEDIYFEVLSDVGQRHRTYEKSIYAALFVLGYLSPWRHNGLWKRMIETQTFPRTDCPLAYPGIAFANFIAAVKYNEAQGHDFLASEQFDVFNFRYASSPAPGQASPRVQALLLMSMMNYFLAAPGRPTVGALFCGGLRQLQEAGCMPVQEMSPPSPPPPPPEDERVFQPGPDVAVERILSHSVGMIAEGLNDVVPDREGGAEDAGGPYSSGSYFSVFVQEFVDYASTDVQRAMRLVDAAYASASRPLLLPRLKSALEQMNEATRPESRQHIVGYVDALAGLEAELDGAHQVFSEDLKVADRAVADWESVLMEIEADVETEPEEDDEYDPTVLDDLTFGRDILQAFYRRSAELVEDGDATSPAALDEGSELPHGHTLADLGPALEAILQAGGFGAQTDADSPEPDEGGTPPSVSDEDLPPTEGPNG